MSTDDTNDTSKEQLLPPRALEQEDLEIQRFRIPMITPTTRLSGLVVGFGLWMWQTSVSTPLFPVIWILIILIGVLFTVLAIIDTYKDYKQTIFSIIQFFVVIVLLFLFLDWWDSWVTLDTR